MKHLSEKSGVTLVEVMISIVLVAVAAAIIYQGMTFSYKSLLRGRARLEAQGIAFDKTWELFNMSFDDLPIEADYPVQTEPTLAGSMFSTNGLVRYSILPETGPSTTWIDYWEIWVQVWPPKGSPLFSVLGSDGRVIAESDQPLAEYKVYRYRGER